jgi:hypothetical protein
MSPLDPELPDSSPDTGHSRKEKATFQITELAAPVYPAR